MLEAVLRHNDMERLIHLLQAALPFLSPCWYRLADSCIHLLGCSELFNRRRGRNFSSLLRDLQGSPPADDLNGLLCAIRPFCSEDELRILNMAEQFQQMQKAFELWQCFSEFMPKGDSDPSSFFTNFASAFQNGPPTTDFHASSFQDTPPTTDFNTSSFQDTPPTTDFNASAFQDSPPTTDSAASSQQNTSHNHSSTEPSPDFLLSFLTPEQRTLYDSIQNIDL